MFPVNTQKLFAQALRIPKGFWYLASPYSHWPEGHDDAFKVASNIAGRLLAMGVRTFSPIAHTHPIYAYTPQVQQMSHQDWMDFDEPFVRAAHGIIVAGMAGWEKSKGVQIEIDWTRDDGKPLWLLDIDYYTVSPLDADGS